ncbi:MULTISPECIES: hypothetical protein [Halomonas]|uniref:hypothetical protein n=1 Tax=Halomonas TaxID=2745 RepID=UPI001C948678|nr:MULTISPECIES: hypothetical protein [Halomonas]MBY6209052.1 hypothetical protein [Halomonas sp. DP3Y7-2]MBY6229207.1 hypothetical protein [Halomonas sp. DP3Y7-1]MCA0917730.1 hypothetical protein [Halomonas denitrificans]
MNRKFTTLGCAASLSVFYISCSYGSETPGSPAQANNPLANMTAFNMQNYFIGDISGSDKEANQFWFRYAQPFSLGESNWLMRASLPVNSYPVIDNGSTETGIGDLNVFTSYLFDTGNPAVSFGVGPQVTAPTASKDEVGSEKWSAGLVNVLFNGSSPDFQYGYLLSWQESFEGNADRDDLDVAAFQPFSFYQLGGGSYLRSAPIWQFNLDNGDYGIPVGLGIGQVLKRDSTVYNFFIEPQVSIADEGRGQAEWQVFFGLNLQFLK